MCTRTGTSFKPSLQYSPGALTTRRRTRSSTHRSLRRVVSRTLQVTWLPCAPPTWACKTTGKTTTGPRQLTLSGVWVVLQALIAIGTTRASSSRSPRMMPPWSSTSSRQGTLGAQSHHLTSLTPRFSVASSVISQSTLSLLSTHCARSTTTRIVQLRSSTSSGASFTSSPPSTA